MWKIEDRCEKIDRIRIRRRRESRHPVYTYGEIRTRVRAHLYMYNETIRSRAATFRRSQTDKWFIQYFSLPGAPACLAISPRRLRRNRRTLIYILCFIFVSARVRGAHLCVYVCASADPLHAYTCSVYVWLHGASSRDGWRYDPPVYRVTNDLSVLNNLSAYMTGELRTSLIRLFKGRAFIVVS